MNFNKGMSSSSYCLTVVSLTVLLQFILVSASTHSTTKYIDAICQQVNDKAFCVKTLNAYPPAVAATNKFLAAKAGIRLGMSFAKKTASFCEKAAKETPRLREQFKECQDAFGTHIFLSLKSASGELKEDPQTANYDAMVCTDHTTMVKNSFVKNKDKASKTVMMMTLKMEKLLHIAVGATISVGG